MSDEFDNDGQPSGPFGSKLYAVSRSLAIFGGLVLCAMAILTTVSVTGRSLASVSSMFAPILGDFELIAVGTGVAVLAFLPYCQIRRDNVIVDFFLAAAPTRFKASLDALGSVIYGVIMVMFAWRTSIGGFDIYKAGESTYMLGIPRWWTFPFAVFCLILMVIVCGYTFSRNIDDYRRNRLSR